MKRKRERKMGQRAVGKSIVCGALRSFVFHCHSSFTYVHLKRIMAYMGERVCMCVCGNWTAKCGFSFRLGPFLMRFSSIFAIHLAAANKARKTRSQRPINVRIISCRFSLLSFVHFPPCTCDGKFNFKALRFRLGRTN